MRAWDDTVIERLRTCVDELEPLFGRDLEGPDAAERDAWLARCGGPRSARGLATDAVLLELCRRLVGERPESAFLRGAGRRVGLDPALVEDARALCRSDAALLGALHEGLTPRAERYSSGQYFTPPPLAAFMQERVRGARVVLDPAVGAGALLASLPRETRVAGVDASPTCAALAAAGLIVRGFTDVVMTAADAVADPPPHRATQDAGMAGFDAVVCNPPYVRHHLLAPAVKRRLVERNVSRWGVRVSSLATSYVYFFLEALAALRPGGTLVFLTPADFLDVRFGAGLKRALLAHATLDDVYLFDRASLAFDGVLTTSAITVARRGPAPAGHHVRFHDAALVGGAVACSSTASRAQIVLQPESRWTLHVGERAPRVDALTRGRPRTLGEFLKVRRGIATGANDFFVLTQATADAWGIEGEFLVPVLAAARDLPDGELTPAHWEALRARGRPCWLLWVTAPRGALAGTRVARYLEEGEARGVHLRFNCRTRAPWYRPESVAVPDVIATYMHRGRARFVRNRTGCRVMSVLLNGFVRDPALDVDALLAALNTAETRQLVEALGRTYGGGLGKIEPRELMAVPMPPLPARALARPSLEQSGASALGDQVVEPLLLEPELALDQE